MRFIGPNMSRTRGAVGLTVHRSLRCAGRRPSSLAAPAPPLHPPLDVCAFVVGMQHACRDDALRLLQPSRILGLSLRITRATDRFIPPSMMFWIFADGLAGVIAGFAYITAPVTAFAVPGVAVNLLISSLGDEPRPVTRPRRSAQPLRPGREAPEIPWLSQIPGHVDLGIARVRRDPDFQMAASLPTHVATVLIFQPPTYLQVAAAWILISRQVPTFAWIGCGYRRKDASRLASGAV